MGAARSVAAVEDVVVLGARTLQAGPVGTPGEATRDGDVASAIEVLYRTHKMNLMRLATLLTGDRGLAEELVQDAFAALFQRWSRLTDKGAAIGYLHRTVVNGARSAQRPQRVARRHAGVTAPAPVPSVDDRVLLAEEHQQVLAALRRLPARQREVLVLRYWSGLSEADIAAALGVSRAAGPSRPASLLCTTW